ncbi:MAG: ClpXP protease specificity-enhancing factor [Betaproteobacteria bacterium]|nr:ClpXP protease specificity-enhancing factor [Betaproteobacteria bacterium]
MEEIPSKPYLLRALYQWCVDNGYTPYLGVRVDSRAQVPTEHVKNGEITLNISPLAVHKLQMGDEQIEFSARFNGLARQIAVPVASVFALYARETGGGMSFDSEPAKPMGQAAGETDSRAPVPSVVPHAAPSNTADESPTKPSPGGKPTLRRVK